MNQDPAARDEARGIIEGLFERMGRAPDDAGSAGILKTLGADIEEFVTMPADLAVVFVTMATDMTEVILKALAEAGFVLVKGLTPA